MTYQKYTMSNGKSKFTTVALNLNEAKEKYVALENCPKDAIKVIKKGIL